MPGRPDLTGLPFGRLRVLGPAPQVGRDRRWACLCDPELGGCGRTCVATTARLRSGDKVSCNCARGRSPEVARAASLARKSHGGGFTPEAASREARRRPRERTATPLPPRKHRWTDRHHLAVRLRAEGLTSALIGERMGITAQAAYGLVRAWREAAKRGEAPAV